MLLIGENSLRIFGRTLVGYQPVADIPYSHVVSAQVDTGMGWQRAGRQLSIRYRDLAENDTTHLLVTPLSSGKEGPFADDIATLIQSRLRHTRLAEN